MTEQKALKSPFPYFGGKSRIADIVWQRFGRPANFVEPFFGSGAILLGCPWPGHTETVNDIDALLSNFWRALQYAPDEVARYADWPVNECVPAGTMIATPNGDLPIEAIRPGTAVWGERNGHIIATTVIATKQSRAAEFYHIGPLRVTGNHPIWTAEQGYQEARLLTDGMHVAWLNSPVDDIDLIMLQYIHEHTAMGNLYPNRPSHRSGALCRCDISRQAAIQRAYVARCDWRKNTPRLLDTFAHYTKSTSDLSNYRGGIGRRLAGCRAALDSALSGNLRSGQSYRWGRWNAGLCPHAGTAREMVSDACGRAILAGSCSSHERQAPYAGSQGQNSGGWSRARPFRNFTREAIQSTYGQGVISRASIKALSRTPGQAVSARTQTEDRPIYHKPQAGSVCGNGRDIPLSDRNGTQPGCDRSIGQSGDPQGLPLQRTSLQIPVAVYNLQTDTGNYFANRILVHNCDLHARHRYLRDRRGFAEELMADPEAYDAKLAGWWVWGISQWIGSGWCLSPAVADVRQLPHVGTRGMGVHRSAEGGIYDYFAALSARLRRVRVCCGDWRRVTGPSVTFRHGLTAVMLDPPYFQDDRADVYAFEGNTIAADVAKWAVENGDNPLLRIALCGYEGHYEMPAGWDKVAWKTPGGYGSQGDGQGRKNRLKEVVWFSPHCLKSKQLVLF